MSLSERFIAKIDKRPDGCWMWTASTLSRGRYGAFYDGKQRHAHRVAYELFIGPIPEGLELDHLCHNTLCVNPAHLEPVTHRENVLRGDSFSARHARKTHCPQGHEYAGENLYIGTTGQRVCRSCARASQRRSRARRAS